MVVRRWGASAVSAYQRVGYRPCTKKRWRTSKEGRVRAEDQWMEGGGEEETLGAVPAVVIGRSWIATLFCLIYRRAYRPLGSRFNIQAVSGKS